MIARNTQIHTLFLLFFVSKKILRQQAFGPIKREAFDGTLGNGISADEISTLKLKGLKCRLQKRECQTSAIINLIIESLMPRSEISTSNLSDGFRNSNLQSSFYEAENVS